jgi:hypothetical protein
MSTCPTSGAKLYGVTTDEAVDAVEARRRKLMMLAKEITLTDEERWELAEYLLHRDVTTWSTLNDAERCRLLDACEGYQYIDVLLSLRPPIS